MSTTQVTEEPDEKKFSRPVLEARQGGDSLSLASVNAAHPSLSWIIIPIS
jgi:hypothetical protein